MLAIVSVKSSIKENMLGAVRMYKSSPELVQRELPWEKIPDFYWVFNGEPFQVWEMWPSPHSEKPVGTEVGGQDPHPWIGSPRGNQACIVPRLLWDLLLLKLPHPELRQKMFTIFIFLKSELDLPSMEHFPFTLQISFFDVWHPLLCCLQKITT